MNRLKNQLETQNKGVGIIKNEGDHELEECCG